MNGPVTSPTSASAVPILDVFVARCEALAILVCAREVPLPDAVDRLQHAAQEYGLIAVLGQDTVQAIIADAFAEPPEPEPEPADAVMSAADRVRPDCCDVCCCAPCLTPGFCETSRKADADPHVIEARERATAKLPPAMSYDALWSALSKHHDVPKSTLDAAAFLINQKNPQRVRAWLLEHSEAERLAIISQIKKQRSRT